MYARPCESLFVETTHRSPSANIWSKCFYPHRASIQKSPFRTFQENPKNYDYRRLKRKGPRFLVKKGFILRGRLPPRFINPLRRIQIYYKERHRRLTYKSQILVEIMVKSPFRKVNEWSKIFLFRKFLVSYEI